MSTISVQASIYHMESGLSAASNLLRTSVETAFTSGAITVTTTPEAMVLGEVSSPRNIFVKLVSGDDALISVDGGTNYPLALVGTDDPMLLTLNARKAGNITAVADTNGSLGGLHFVLGDADGIVWPWFNVALKGAGTLTLNSDPLNGETVTIGAKTYTFRTASASFVCKATADISQGEYFDITFGGSTKRFWYDIDAAGTGAPADPGGGLNEINIATGNTDAQVATATELVVEAVTNLTSSAVTNTITVYHNLPGTILVEDSVGDVLGTITAIALVANEVLVGAAVTDSLDNLIAAINAGAGSGTVYGTGTTANASVTAVAGSGDTMVVTAILGGATVVATTETLSDVLSVWGAASLAGGTDGSTAPTVTTERLISVDFDEDSADTVVAQAVVDALSADGGFYCTRASAILTITYATPGPWTTLAAGDSTFTTVTTTGTVSPTVYFKSLGTSQMVVTVAPN